MDVERNLRAPLAGIANVARATGVDVTVPEIAIRTGDTPALERAKFLRAPADILITTPDSLFHQLNSTTRERLADLTLIGVNLLTTGQVVAALGDDPDPLLSRT